MATLRPLIKYIGNKYKFAAQICAHFPDDCATYFEPFLGSGAILGHLAPRRAIAGDTLRPLIDFWRLVKARPRELAQSYAENYTAYARDPHGTYETVKARFNAAPNPHDFLFVSRTCYAGVIRFRRDGYLSTPIGPHKPIPPAAFAARLDLWTAAVRNTDFVCADYAEIVGAAKRGDVVYCDPPYIDSQRIIYGAQDFSLARLFGDLADAKRRGAFIALSIDGVKKSGARPIAVEPPRGLFPGEGYIPLGGSMLKRFWRDGATVADEHVLDRLLVSRLAGTRLQAASTSP